MDYPLSKPVVRIGRSRNNDIVLGGDPAVSRYHAEIRREAGVYVLLDMGSRNGTRVNGERVSRHILVPGDVIQIGKSKISYSHGVLSLPPEAVSQIAAHPSAAGEGYGLWLWVSVVGVLLIVVAAVVAFALNRTPATVGHDPEAIAKQWVWSHPDSITLETTSNVNRSAVPVEESVLADKIREQVARKDIWSFKTIGEVTEGVYRVEAQATISLGLVDSPNECVSITYIITVDTNRGEVKQTYLQNCSVNFC